MDYDGREDGYNGQQPYGHSPLVPNSAAAPPQVSDTRAIGVTHDGDYHGDNDAKPKASFWRIITCRCG